MELNVLNQLYNHPSSFEKSLIMRSVFENKYYRQFSIFTGNATAHVINEIYECVNVDYKQVTVDHKFFNNEKRHSDALKRCVRCKVNDVNPELGSFLE